MNLGEQFKGHDNNLVLIRTIAAALVILSHSYPLVYGTNTTDILSRLSDSQIQFGNLAVCIFFLYSGFLISKSVARRSTGSFILARLIRVVPPLAAVTFACAFVLGPVFTELSAAEYFASPQTYKYLGNSIFLLIHELPGVFIHNPYNATVNGALWTLPVEMVCYFVCLIMQKVGLLQERRMKWTIPLFVLCYIAGFRLLRNNALLISILRPCGMFYAGMLSYVYRNRIRLMPIPALLCSAGFVIGLLTGTVEFLLLVTLPYPLLYAAFGTKTTICRFFLHNDYSYGMYLTGWPLAQCLVVLAENRIPGLTQAGIVILVSHFCGMALYALIDRPLLFRFQKNNS